VGMKGGVGVGGSGSGAQLGGGASEAGVVVVPACYGVAHVDEGG